MCSITSGGCFALRAADASRNGATVDIQMVIRVAVVPISPARFPAAVGTRNVDLAIRILLDRSGKGASCRSEKQPAGRYTPTLIMSAAGKLYLGQASNK